jgi:hypothetical protein
MVALIITSICHDFDRRDRFEVAVISIGWLA